MNAHDTKLPHQSTDPDPTPVTSATRTRRNNARGNAAVVVWSIAPDVADDSDAGTTPEAGGSPLTLRLAHHLVAIYSDVNDTVIDLDADVNVRHAAETTGRHYQAVTDPATATNPAGQARPATLIMLRWPCPATTPWRRDATSLLSTCRPHLTDDGSTVVVVTAATPATAGTRYGEHEQVLLPAAQAANLQHLHDIVAIEAEDGRDTFTYATASHALASDGDSESDTPSRTTSTTLVIFGHPRTRP